MPFTVCPALPSDIPYLSTIQWAALLSNPLIQTLYPQGPTSALIAFTRESYQKAIQFPSVRLIKAIDEERGEIVAFAKWILYPEEQQDLLTLIEGDVEKKEARRASGWVTEEEVPQRPQGVNEKALGAWNAKITSARTRIMRKQEGVCHTDGGCSLECYFASFAPALWVLDIIHTHPSHQGRGAASQLVKWGTDLADKARMQCYVESSPAGYPLFKNYDFEDITDIEIELSKYREGYGNYKYRHIVMTRPPDTPPMVPPKDLIIHQTSEWDFGFQDTASLTNGNNGPRISGKASLIEIKRSPRPDRSISSKSRNSDLALSPKPDRSTLSGESAVSPISPILDQSFYSSRESDSVTSITGRFPEPPTSKPPSRAGLMDMDPFSDDESLNQPALKPDVERKSPSVDRVWFSEHH